VIGAMLAAVAAAGVRRLWCNARVEQVEFYRKRGMEVSPPAGGQSPVAQALVRQRGGHAYKAHAHVVHDREEGTAVVMSHTDTPMEQRCTHRYTHTE
jgi:hypothetical protein